MSSNIWTPDPTSVAPGFKAKNASAITVNSTEVQNYLGESNDHPDYNVGSGFNAATGRFTAQRTGYYHFNGLITWSSAATVGATMRINGSSTRSELLAQETTSVGGVYRNFAIDVYLEQGEYVSIWSGVLTAGNMVVSRFSGHAL